MLTRHALTMLAALAFAGVGTHLQPVAGYAEAGQVIGHRLRPPLRKIHVERPAPARVGMTFDQEAFAAELRTTQRLGKYLGFFLRLVGQLRRTEQE